MGIVLDPQGNWYIAEWHRNRIIKVDSHGMTSIFAGTGDAHYGGDGGPATKASFGLPHDTVIGNGILYFSDVQNAAVRAIDLKTGIITTVAGTGEKGYSGDGGPAKEAKFNFPVGVSLSPDNQRLYIADMNGGRVRMVTLKTGIVTPIAGNGTRGVPEDGVAALGCPLVQPRGVREDSHGNIYILEQGGNALRVITKEGKIHTILGPGIEPSLDQPKEAIFDRKGDLIFIDSNHGTIRKYSPATGKTSTLVGTGENGNRLTAGDPLRTQLNQPHFLYLDPASGDLYIADTFNDRILRYRE
jgi:DNA-binding beta-propeller fold protein YncE